MADHTKRRRGAQDGVEGNEQVVDADGTRNAEAKPVFNPKGIASNVFLTAAAAIVPLVIVGVAGVKAILGARRPKH